MTYDEIQQVSVYSSDLSWQTEELRFARRELNVVEIVFRGHGKKEGSRMTLRLSMPEPAIVAYELYLGFDIFHIVDLAKLEPWREIGRFELHIFRDDDAFRFAFDSYEIEEEANKSSQPTSLTRRG